MHCTLLFVCIHNALERKGTKNVKYNKIQTSHTLLNQLILNYVYVFKICLVLCIYVHMWLLLHSVYNNAYTNAYFIFIIRNSCTKTKCCVLFQN